MKFKVGDRVKLVKYNGGGIALGVVGVIKRVNRSRLAEPYEVSFPGYVNRFQDDLYRVDVTHIELVNKGDNMGRRTFRLLKETDILKKGAIFQEMCDDGDQDYEMIDGERKFEKPQSCADRIIKSREGVEKNPTWYEEVFNPATMWVTKAELAAMSSAFQPKKRGRPSKK